MDQTQFQGNFKFGTPSLLLELHGASDNPSRKHGVSAFFGRSKGFILLGRTKKQSLKRVFQRLERKNSIPSGERQAFPDGYSEPVAQPTRDNRAGTGWKTRSGESTNNILDSRIVLGSPTRLSRWKRCFVPTWRHRHPFSPPPGEHLEPERGGLAFSVELRQKKEVEYEKQQR